MAVIKYVDLERLTQYDGLIKTYIGDADAKSFKSAKFDDSTRVLSLYKAESTDGVADFTVTIPKTDVSNLLEKLASATAGNVVVAKADGTIEDGGTALSDLATKTEVEAVDDKVGTLADLTTTEKNNVVGAINELEGKVEALEAGTYDDSEVRELIQDNKDIIDTLVGADNGKSVRAIANEELAAQLITEDAAENLNSLEELAAWIQSHPDDASAMNATIVKLQNILDGIGDVDSGEKASVVAYVTDAISALNIGDYAKASDLTALASRVDDIKTDSHTHDNKTVLDSITSDKVTAWDDSEQNAKDYADGLAVNYDSAGSATAAQTNAQSYADGLNTTMGTRVDGVGTRVTTLEGLVGDGFEVVTSDEITGLF